MCSYKQETLVWKICKHSSGCVEIFNDHLRNPKSIFNIFYSILSIRISWFRLNVYKEQVLKKINFLLSSLFSKVRSYIISIYYNFIEVSIC